MTDEVKNGSAPAGSPEAAKTGPEGQPEGSAPAGDSKATITEEQYKSLESKLGTQGKELGDYRTFVKSITPLLDKLDDQPELIQAILDGKITAEMAEAVVEGKVSKKDAEKVSSAHDKVKKDLGKKGYDKADANEIEKRVEDEITKVRGDFDKKLKESEEMRSFKEKVNDFISNTKDFPEFAEEVEKLILDNPNIDDIELAYHVVKGKKLQEDKAKADEAANSEAAKGLALNATGGSSQGAKVVSDEAVIDQLISSKSNPNAL